MCSCHQQSNVASIAPEASSEAISFLVEDMTCGHCAGTIKQAIEGLIPGAAVTANPGSKLVEMRGSTDLTAIKAAVVASGYTPGAGRVS